MVSLRSITEEEIRWAEEVDKVYEKLVKAPVEVSSDLDATLSTGLRNRFFEQTDITLHLDDVLLLERTGIPKGDEEKIGKDSTISGFKSLKIELQTETAKISYEGRVAIKPGSNHLLIQFWDEKYPPELLLNEEVINKSIGPHYKQVGELPSVLRGIRRIGLNVRDADEQLGQEFKLTEKGLIPNYNLIKLWIDEEKVESINSTIKDFTIPIRHQTTLTPGKHRVKVTSPVLHTVIFDGDIVFNGIDLIELTVHTCKTLMDPCRITIKKGLEEVFKGSYKDLEYTEKYSSMSQSIRRDSSKPTGGI